MPVFEYSALTEAGKNKTNLEVTDEHYWTNIRRALEARGDRRIGPEVDHELLVVDVRTKTHAPPSTWRCTSNDRSPAVSAASGRSAPLQVQVTRRAWPLEARVTNEPVAGAPIFAHGGVRSGPRRKIAVQYRSPDGLMARPSPLPPYFAS